MEVQYSVYALISQKDGRIYVGMSKNIAKRIEDHRFGRVKSTKPFRPWKLFYTENVGCIKNARSLEKYYKSGAGKEYLKSLIRPR